jgi:hypothetical protein
MNDSIQIYNNLTGETIVREMTDEEQAQRNAEIAAWQLEKQAKQDAEEATWRTKVSAYEKLGLTSAEIEVLAPTPKWLKEGN